MKNKIQKFFCKNCSGEGYVARWEGDNKKTGFEDLVLKDCDICDGKGYIELEVIDNRKITKNKKADYDKEY